MSDCIAYDRLGNGNGIQPYIGFTITHNFLKMVPYSNPKTPQADIYVSSIGLGIDVVDL